MAQWVHYTRQQKARSIAESGSLPGSTSPELVAISLDGSNQLVTAVYHEQPSKLQVTPNSGPTRREFSGSVISDRQKSNGVTPETLKPGYGSLQGNGSMTLYARLSLHRQTSGSSRYNSRLKMPTVFERTTRMIRMLGRKVDPLYGYLEVNVVRTLLRGSPYWAG